MFGGEALRQATAHGEQTANGDVKVSNLIFLSDLERGLGSDKGWAPASCEAQTKRNTTGKHKERGINAVSRRQASNMIKRIYCLNEALLKYK